jgi:hypothetical protein
MALNTGWITSLSQFSRFEPNLATYIYLGSNSPRSSSNITNIIGNVYMASQVGVWPRVMLQSVLKYVVGVPVRPGES